MLAGMESLPATIKLVSTRSRQFAKRQATWFRGLSEVRPWPVSPDEPAERVAVSLALRIESRRLGQEIR